MLLLSPPQGEEGIALKKKNTILCFPPNESLFKLSDTAFAIENLTMAVVWHLDVCTRHLWQESALSQGQMNEE